MSLDVTSFDELSDEDYYDTIGDAQAELQLDVSLQQTEDLTIDPIEEQTMKEAIQAEERAAANKIELELRKIYDNIEAAVNDISLDTYKENEGALINKTKSESNLSPREIVLPSAKSAVLPAKIGSNGLPLLDTSDPFAMVKKKAIGDGYDIRQFARPDDSFYPTDLERASTHYTDSQCNDSPNGIIQPELPKTKRRLQDFLSPKSEKFESNSVPTFASHKDKREFQRILLIQELHDHKGPIWCLKFSLDGLRMATGGHDGIIRIWRVIDSTETIDTSSMLFSPVPELILTGHTSPVVDISWCRSNFFLSASMDKMVRLWHISYSHCLHCFQHPDSVPAIDFHPKEERYYLSGCFDNKLRIWDISEGRVISFIETPTMITAVVYNPSGTKVVAGLLNGNCIFYQLDQRQKLSYYTQIECHNASGVYKNGRKVTSIQFTPEAKHILVTTNDSRLRLYSVDNFARVCKYKGLCNNNLQIKASFSQDGEHIICGSENGQIYIWNTLKMENVPRIHLGRKQDKNRSFERFDGTGKTLISSAKASKSLVIVAAFAPANTYAIAKNSYLSQNNDVHAKSTVHYIMAAGYDGCIRVYENL